VSSSAAPQNAATAPVAARPMASRSRGALGSAGGASWKVSTDISRPAAAIPATIQNSGRQAWNDAWAPPISGPAVTAPKMHRFKITAVQRSLRTGKPRNSGGAAAISSMLVHRPCRMCPAMNIAGPVAAAASTEPIKSPLPYASSSRRCGSSCASWTASTVPTAYPALARPKVRPIDWGLMCSWLAMIGVNGCSAADRPR
jgi:hypothetical protein